jgi:hypothetical protein
MGIYEKETLLRALEKIISLHKNSNQLLLSIKEEISNIEPQNTLSSDQTILYPADVRRILNISESSYYRMIKQGNLVPRILGSLQIFYYSDLLEAMKISKNKGRI